MANIDVDKILLSLGWFGPYQRQQCVYFALAMTGAAYAILAYIFAAYRPPFACDVPVNNSLVASVVNGTDIQLIGSTCEINVVKNNTNSSGHDVLMTLPCHYGYNYDIQQDTVITEWDLVCQSEGKGGLTNLWLCDESLRWLVANGKMKEAQKLIQKIAMKNKKDPDKIVPLLSSLDSEAENGVGYEKEEKINDIHVTSPVNPVSSAIDPVTSEVNPVTSRSSNNPTVLDIFRNAFVCKIALIWMFTCISRKKLTIGFHLLAGIAMILSVVLISFREKHEIFVKLAIACSFIAKTGIAGSYNSIFIYTPETFPTNLRNMGIGIGAFGSHIGGVIAPFATLLAFHVEWGPGVVFGACCLIVSFLLLFLPETKGRPLPQTIMEMKQWNKKHCNQSDEKTIYVN
ncbi:OCTN [Mytilus edulis]|uniref:SLC22A4_5 n=1 Tax=Mytilus edulis TaxID=6550 RepID=A0A8S3U2T1_MYTED|nr:OCTN [Mytilus edulis]